MTKHRKTLERDILHAIWLVNCLKNDPDAIPVMQGMIVAYVNSHRKRQGRPEVKPESFARKFRELERAGKVKRVRWFRPNSGNLWVMSK